MSGLTYLVGVVIFAIGIMLSIALHELGHLLPAKRFGVRCTQYMIGFGPTLFSRRRGDTEYGVKAIPLGGYVRMIGMFAPRSAVRIGRTDPEGRGTGRWSALIEQARAQSLREAGDTPRDQYFYTKRPWQRFVIMLSGPAMNLVVALVLFVIILCGFGLPRPSTRIDVVSQCILPVNAPKDRTCTATDPLAPAAGAGLRPGDRITAVNGAPVDDWDRVRDLIRANGNRRITLQVRRGGQLLTVPVTPATTPVAVMKADGVTPQRNADGSIKTIQAGFLGVSPATERRRESLLVVPGQMGQVLWKTATVTVDLPRRIASTTSAAFGHGHRDPNGPVSIVGVGRFAGEIASAQDESVTDRFADLLTILASLNVMLFVLNMVPLLPLDGGHMAGVLWESLRRRVARLRSRVDPGPVDTVRALPLTYGVASLLIGMSALLIYADIVTPIHLGG